jgi:hypothetical protein
MKEILIRQMVKCPRAKDKEIDQRICWDCPFFEGRIGRKIKFIRCKFGGDKVELTVEGLM